MQIVDLDDASPLLDDENIGSLAVFGFRRLPDNRPAECRVWVCRNVREEDAVEGCLGPVDPDRSVGALCHAR